MGRHTKCKDVVRTTVLLEGVRVVTFIAVKDKEAITTNFLYKSKLVKVL